jgi:cobalt/nickel transport system permease protein
VRLPHAHALFVHGTSPVHRLPAEAKIVALALFVVAVVATPREQTWAFAAEGALLVVAATAAALPPRVVLGRLAFCLPLVALAMTLPFVGGGPRTEVGPISVSIEGLWAAWAVAAKGVVCLGASLVVTAATPAPDLLAGLSRLRMPGLITAIAGFMIRYIDVIAEEAGRARIAMAARGYAPRWLWHARPAASAAGALFVRAYEQGERTYDAMLARGYYGTMPRIDERVASPREWTAALAAPVVATAVMALALAARAGMTP